MCRDVDLVHAPVAEATCTLEGPLDIRNVRQLVAGEDPVGVQHALLIEFEDDMHKTIQTNAIGVAHLFNAFLPLVLKGDAKKVIAITSGMGEIDLTNTSNMWLSVPYAVSKATLNMIVAKFSAEYKEQGVLFLGISPGFVATSEGEGKSAIFL